MTAVRRGDWSNSVALPLLRRPGKVVPGRFPLAVERLRGLVDEPSGPTVAEIHRSRMVLDLDDYVQRKIWYGCFEPAQVRVVERMIRPGDTVIDVGANVGFYTLLFARLVGSTGTVHAFEPVMADALELNLELNGYRQVTVHRAAAGAENGFVRLSNPRPRASSGNWRRSDGANGFEVPQVTLDQYVNERVAFVKIDVEGMEADVLAGLAGSIRSSPHRHVDGGDGWKRSGRTGARYRPVARGRLYAASNRRVRTTSQTRQIEPCHATCRPLLPAGDPTRKPRTRAAPGPRLGAGSHASHRHRSDAELRTDAREVSAERAGPEPRRPRGAGRRQRIRPTTPSRSLGALATPSCAPGPSEAPSETVARPAPPGRPSCSSTATGSPGR